MIIPRYSWSPTLQCLLQWLLKAVLQRFRMKSDKWPTFFLKSLSATCLQTLPGIGKRCPTFTTAFYLSRVCYDPNPIRNAKTWRAYCLGKVYWLVSSCVNLIEDRAIWEKGISIEKMPPLDCPVVFGDIFLVDWRRRAQPTVLGATSGLVVLEWANRQHSFMSPEFMSWFQDMMDSGSCKMK